MSEGALGVNAFFALSGFILVYAHLKDYPTPALPSFSYYWQFLVKRLARLYPAYLLGLVVCLPIVLYFHAAPPHFPAIVALDALLLEAYIPYLSQEFIGGGGWSVSTEFFFYMLFPLLLPLFLQLRSKRACLILLAVVIVVASLPGLNFVLHPGTSFKRHYSFAPARLPEFIAGMLLGLLVLRHEFRVSERTCLALLAAVALILASDTLKLPGFTVYNVVALPAILATIAVLMRAEETKLLRWVGAKPMQYLGRISYSFFIIQIPLTLVLFYLTTQKILPAECSYLLLPLFLLNLVLAAAAHEFVEKKAHRLILSVFLPKHRKVLRHGELAA